MVFRLSPPNIQFCNSTGVPLAGGFLYFYQSGTSTPQNTYKDAALSVANTNPIVLDSAGYAGNIFLIQGANYKVVLTDINGVQQWTIDPVSDPTSGGGTFSSFIAINGSAGSLRSLLFQTAGSNRFGIVLDAIPESGTNAGSNLQFYTYDDTGAQLQNVATVTRSTGAVQFRTAVSLLTPPSFVVGYNAQTGTTYTIQTSDLSTLISRSNAAAIADTVPQATGNFGVGFWFDYENIGNSVAILTPASGTIGGHASLPVGPGCGVRLVSDGNNWQIDGPDPSMGRVLLNTMTASAGSTTVLADLTSLLTPVFTEFEILITNFIGTTATAIASMQVYSGAAYQTTNYKCEFAATSSGGSASANPTTYICVANVLGNTMSAGGVVSLQISNPSDASTVHPFVVKYSGEIQNSIAAYMGGTGYWGTAGAITGFKIYPSTGSTFGAATTVRVYGIR